MHPERQKGLNDKQNVDKDLSMLKVFHHIG